MYGDQDRTAIGYATVRAGQSRSRQVIFTHACVSLVSSVTFGLTAGRSHLRVRPPSDLHDYEMGPSCAQNPLGRHCALGPLAESAGARPSQSRDQGIKRVRKVLEGTRTTVSESGKGEPLGVALSFDVTVTGLRGRDVQIYWSMLSADTDQALGRSWLKNTRATTLRPKHETDQFRTDLWLPLPKPEGDYVARVTLLGPEGGRLTSARSRVFH